MAANEKYIEEIANERILTDKEEAELAERIKIGDAKALEQLTKANLKFVVSLAHQYKNRGIDEDDLISEGNIGMMYAAQKFDATKGTRFVSFAAIYIRRAMEEAIRENTQIFKVPTGERTKSTDRQSRPVSIDQPRPVGSNSSFTLQTVIENENAPHVDESLNKQILGAEILRGMDILDARERKIITLIYGLREGEVHTMAEIAEMMGIKRERVRQIRNKAIRKLHKKLK